ncbi:MAG TPA: EAL domain-containing protein, partial [Bacillales bacterium]|nr:EAL domain-containing protein [Bacillales bacterium]
DPSGTVPSAIVNLANALNLEVIAEGVETADQFAQIRNWGCNELQGYLFSRPLPAAKFKKLLESGNSLYETLNKSFIQK